MAAEEGDKKGGMLNIPVLMQCLGCISQGHAFTQKSSKYDCKQSIWEKIV